MSELGKKSYIGIDVAKAKLDVFILESGEHFVVLNDDEGVRYLLDKIQSTCKIQQIHISMESTGGYEQFVAHTLSQAGYTVSVLNPRQIRDFAKSLNKLAKTDKIDALVIAQYAKMANPRPTMFYDTQSDKLAQLQGRRRQLIDMITAEKNRLDKMNHHMKGSIERTIQWLEEELDKINKELEQAIDVDEKASHKRELLMSIKGIGKITAQALIAWLPELGLLTGKEISALGGVAPFNRDSGTLRGKRSVWGGRNAVRSALHMATLVAVRHNPYIRAFYQRLIAAGKAKMVAITAAMHKLLLIMNAMLKHDQPWDEEKERNYLRALGI